MRVDRRGWIIGAATVLVGGHAGAGGDELPRVALATLGGTLPEADVAMVKTALLAFYEVEVVVLPRADLPKQAYYPKRKRYRAEKLLDFLTERAPKSAHRVLGITAVDISTSKPPHEDWGVIGLANMGNTACVISSFRCKRLARNAEHARQRFGKVAVHEVGHTFGLPHCPTKDCLMQDAKGSVLTSDREYDLCTRCRQMLIRRGYGLSGGTPPWPEPKPK